MTVKLYLYNEDAVSERQWFPHKGSLPDYWCNGDIFNSYFGIREKRQMGRRWVCCFLSTVVRHNSCYLPDR
jgi:hypothetical protein